LRVNCPVCQSAVPETAKFCLECGSNLSGISSAERGRVGTTGGVAGATGTTPAGFSGDTSLGDRKTVGWTAGAPPQVASPETAAPFVSLASRYDLQEPLGSGGFATVFRALDRNLQRPVAIKRLHAGDATHPETALAIERFLREALAVAQLSHRNIVTVYEQARDDEGHYIVMELMTEGTLHDHYRRAGKLSVAEAVRFIRGICRGLSYAHRRNLVHRDIKPRNILLAQEDGELVPKIVDFGLARVGFDMESSPSRSGYGLGTPCYMPPEQRRDAKSVNHTADIYAVGKTLYELVTGELPENVDPELLADQPELSRVIFRCIKTRPEERYFSVDELIADLEKLPVGPAGPQSARPQAATSIDDLVKRNACPNCGASNKSQDRFCLQCGTGLMRKCPECDRENSTHVRYCGGCGTDAEALLRLQDAASKMEGYAGDRRWSRVVKEFELSPQDARVPGKKGRELLEHMATLADMARHNEAEIELLSAELSRAPGDAAHDRLLSPLLRLQSIAPPDAERDRLIVRLQQQQAEQQRLEDERRAAELRLETERQAEQARQEAERKTEQERLEREQEMERVRREAEHARREREANRLLAEAKECIRGRQWEAAQQRLSQVDPEHNRLEHASLTAAARNGIAQEAADLERTRVETRLEKGKIESLSLPGALDEAIRRTEQLLRQADAFPQDAGLAERAQWARNHLAALQVQRRSRLNVDDDFAKAQQVLALRGNSRYFIEESWQARLPVWNAAADSGDPKGMWLTADCHLEGIGGPRNLPRAVALFTRAAQLGLPAAEVTLGRLYSTGTGVPEDMTQAVTWWRKAADRKDPAAICELARCYLKGRGVVANPAQAVSLLQQPAVANDPRALLQLGLCHKAGQGVAKDATAAHRLFLKAAQLGKTEAMYQLAVSLLARKGDEKNQVRGVQSRLDAIDWLKKAAELGSHAAVTKLEELGVDSGREVRTNSIGMEFVRIPQGGFRMGSPAWTAPDHQSYRDESPEHFVQITRPFYLARTPVTQEQYQQVVGKNPSKFKGLLRKAPTNPVETVSWFEAITFCNLLSAREGCAPYYRLDRADSRGRRLSTVDRGRMGIRLPSQDDRRPVVLARRRRTGRRIRLGAADRRRQGNAPGCGKEGQPLRSVRHARQRVGMVLGLVRCGILRKRTRQRPGRPFDRDGADRPRRVVGYRADERALRDPRPQQAR
jgi:serine/threonine protein kinase/TPR repeat protein